MTERQFYDWQTGGQRPSKRQKDLLDIMRLIESHPQLSDKLHDDVKTALENAL